MNLREEDPDGSSRFWLNRPQFKSDRGDSERVAAGLEPTGWNQNLLLLPYWADPMDLLPPAEPERLWHQNAAGADPISRFWSDPVKSSGFSAANRTHCVPVTAGRFWSTGPVRVCSAVYCNMCSGVGSDPCCSAWCSISGPIRPSGWTAAASGRRPPGPVRSPATQRSGRSWCSRLEEAEQTGSEPEQEGQNQLLLSFLHWEIFNSHKQK